MARSHLTLAALATAAVADLDVVAVGPLTSGGDGDFSSALLTDRAGRRWTVRVPRNAKAEARQAADLVALRALSSGVRTRLPFAVASYAGQSPAWGTRAVVCDYVPGAKVPLEAITHPLAESIGRAVAAIHALPTSFVSDAGLPVASALESLRSCVSVIDRAAGTGLVPAALLERWHQAAEDPTLWQFQPTVANAALGADSFLSDGGVVTGVLGWQDLRVTDPARDLFWLLGSPHEGVADAAFDAYVAARGSTDRNLRHRARLYSELELAKWLLHGTDTRSTEVVDDAVQLMTNLVDSVRSDLMNPIGPVTMPTPTVDEVEALLARSERAV